MGVFARFRQKRNEMKQNMRKSSAGRASGAVPCCAALQCPPRWRAIVLMRAGDAAIAQIEEEEGFRAEKYSSGGKWYIGYGTECGAEGLSRGHHARRGGASSDEQGRGVRTSSTTFWPLRRRRPRRGSSTRAGSASATISALVDERHRATWSRSPAAKRRDAP